MRSTGRWRSPCFVRSHLPQVRSHSQPSVRSSCVPESSLPTLSQTPATQLTFRLRSKWMTPYSRQGRITSHRSRLTACAGVKLAGHTRDAQVFQGDDAPNEKAQIRFTRYGKDSFPKDFSTASDGSPHRSVSRCSVTRGEKQRAAKDWVQTKQSFTTVALNTHPQH